MSEIERAIKAMENIAEYWTCRPSERQAAQLALAALREKAERDKGCEYCTDCEDLASIKRVGCIYIDGNLLVADLYSESMAAAVCYCPMCGKRLEEEHDGR